MDETNKRATGPQIRCSFCERDRARTGRLIAGPGDVMICDECGAEMSFNGLAVAWDCPQCGWRRRL